MYQKYFHMKQQRPKVQYLHEEMGLEQEKIEQLGKTDECKNMNDRWN